MKNLRYIFLLFSLGLFAIACSDDNDDAQIEGQEETSIFDNLDANPNAALLYQTVADLSVADTFGAGQNDPVPEGGRRIDFNFEGPVQGQINGNFTGIDYGVLLPDGSVLIDVFGTIVTDDGARIGFNYRGEGIPDSETSAVLRETGTLITHNTDYAYLNDLFVLVVGSSDLVANTLTLSYYGFEQDPFGGEDPYAEPESPDYTNFPFNMENIEDRPDATLVYEAVTATSGIEGLGLDAADVFAGQVAIPAEGLRMNFDFAGTTTGELNGIIEGTDYLTILPDGSLIINVRGKIITPEGDRVALDVDGRLTPSATPGVSNFFETALLRTSSSNFGYLNGQYIIGVGTSDQATGANALRLYRFDEDPLE